MAELTMSSSGDHTTQDAVAPTVPMLDKKLNSIFTWWDQNSDGVVTDDDVESMITMFTALADPTDEKNKSTMRKGLLKWWDLLLEGRQDKTSAKLEKQDFLHAMRAIVIAPDNFDVAIGTVVDGMLGALDRDRNGVLSPWEWTAMYTKLGRTEAESVEAFKRLDRDSNGVITHAELQQAMREFYMSPDPDAPGQWLLGPPQDL